MWFDLCSNFLGDFSKMVDLYVILVDQGEKHQPCDLKNTSQTYNKRKSGEYRVIFNFFLFLFFFSPPKLQNVNLQEFLD